MCWDCSSVNDDQHIYVEKSEDLKGLIWACQKCNVNKVDVITSLKKIKEHLEEEIEEVREKIKEETVKYEEVKYKVQNGKNILEKGVIINVQEEHIEKINDECNNNNKKIESLEIENNILKDQLEDYEPTEEMKEEKAVMRPALEYASSVWSPIASSTSINKLQVMQNAALRTATGCTQDTNIQHLHDETLTLPILEHLQLHASQYKQKTQHPSHPLHKHTTYFNTPRLKKHYF